MARRDRHGVARRAMLTGEGFCWKRPLENRRFGKPPRRSSLRPLRAVLENPEAIMSKLTIVAFDGTRHELDVANGSTVMENAVRNSVPGIEAECGGACACAGGDGRGHAGLRLRGAPHLQALLSDQDVGCARRARGSRAGTPGLTSSTEVEVLAAAPFRCRPFACVLFLAGLKEVGVT